MKKIAKSLLNGCQPQIRERLFPTSMYLHSNSTQISAYNKNDMNRSKMIANYNGFGLEQFWIRTGLD